MKDRILAAAAALAGGAGAFFLLLQSGLLSRIRLLRKRQRAGIRYETADVLSSYVYREEKPGFLKGLSAGLSAACPLLLFMSGLGLAAAALVRRKGFGPDRERRTRCQNPKN